MADWFTQNFFFVYGFWLIVILSIYGLAERADEKAKSTREEGKKS